MSATVIYDLQHQLSQGVAQHVSLGMADGADTGIGLDLLLAGRLFIQGSSGSGKSWLLRRLLEQSTGRIQHIIVDPEGELAQLAARLNYPVVGSDYAGGKGFAQRVRETRQSVCIDLSQDSMGAKLAAAGQFLRELVAVPSSVWPNAALVIVDEAQVFAPQSPSGLYAKEQRACTAAMIDLMSLGRKRGLAGVVASQRIARVSKSVVSEALNYMVGGTHVDVDVRRAAEMLGIPVKQAVALLPELPQGAFVTLGPAFYPDDKKIIEVGGLRHTNIGTQPTAKPVPQRGAAEGARVLGLRAATSWWRRP